MHLIAGIDYARQLVNAFKFNGGSKEYIVQGPEGFTADEAAQIFKEHYRNGSIRVRKIPFALMRFLGSLSGKISYGAQITEALNNYPEKFEASITWAELGEPVTRFIEYVNMAGSRETH